MAGPATTGTDDEPAEIRSVGSLDLASTGLSPPGDVATGLGASVPGPDPVATAAPGPDPWYEDAAGTAAPALGVPTGLPGVFCCSSGDEVAARAAAPEPAVGAGVASEPPGTPPELVAGADDARPLEPDEAAPPLDAAPPLEAVLPEAALPAAPDAGAAPDDCDPPGGRGLELAGRMTSVGDSAGIAV